MIKDDSAKENRMNKWQTLRNRIETMARDVLSDDRVKETLREIARVRAELEREVEMLRRELRASSEPVFDDLEEKKAFLDRVRRREI